MVRNVLTVILVSMVTGMILAEDVPGVDELFAQARELGFAGRREEARAICEQILKRSPGYHDVRVFLGRLHAWDKDYDAARGQLLRVLEERPEHVDARVALIDVEHWSHQDHEALRLANEGLDRHPGEASLLYRKARSLARLGFEKEALAVARDASRADPGLEEARRLVVRLEDDELKNKIGLDLRYDWLDDSPDRDPDPWRRATVEYTRRFGFGSVIWRAAVHDQFDDTGSMYEIDAYPGLGKGRYLYLNIGHGTESFLPELRHGAEYFQGLPKSLEFSLGYRRLEFENTDVTLFTGTFGAYRGNYFIWIRPYVSDSDDRTTTLDNDDGTSISGNLSIRRYFSDPETYMTLTVGGGSDPEADTDATTQVTDTIRLDTRRARIDAQKRLGMRWILSGRVAYRFEEFPAFDRKRWTLSVGLERLF